MKDWARKHLRWSWPWIAALIALAGVIVLLVLQLHKKDGEADSTTLVLLILATVLLFAVLAPRTTGDVLRRISTLKLGGVEVGLKEIRRSERIKPIPSEDDGVPVKRPPSSDYGDVVETLEGRLRFAWEFLQFDGGEVKKEDYRGIAGKLRTELLLTQDEEVFTLDLLEGISLDISDWPSTAQNEFLDSAYAFAIRFGPMVWNRKVRRTLDADGWFIADYRQRRGHRPDFLAYRDQRWSLFASRVGASSGGDYDLSLTANRLADFPPEDSEGPKPTARFIVLPDIRDGQIKPEQEKSSGRSEWVEVVKLSELKHEWTEVLTEKA